MGSRRRRHPVLRPPHRPHDADHDRLRPRRRVRRRDRVARRLRIGDGRGDPQILLEALADDPEAEEFLRRASDSLTEADDGTVTMQTFQLLDDVAEHIEAVAYEGWLSDPAVRAAIAEVAGNTFTE